jgi:glycosyltransferase involved in cell wall biosynthesis
MKVAIVHPWFIEMGGGEKVVDVLADMYPDADIFALAVNRTYLSPRLQKRNIYTSFLNKAVSLFFRYKRTFFMLLFPWAVERLDVSKYDLILSSCGPAVMGVNPGQNAIHICYVHSPQRAWWDLYAKRQAQMGWLKRQIFVVCAVFIRMWEFNGMQRVDYVVVNSNYIAHRVFKYFRRESTVIYPPVDTSRGYLADRHEDYYLSLSRLEMEKGLELLIHACNRLKRRLLIAGTGRKEKQLKAIAGSTIEFLGRVPDVDLPALYANCRAFLFAADEDFGIAPVEAQAFGRPVIAYGHGGSLETVRVGDAAGRSDTGVFFSEQTVESVVDGILGFEARENGFIPAEIQEHARQFDTSVFIEKMQQFVSDAMRKE